MKYKKGIFIIIFAIVILFFISTKVNAGSLRLNNLMYDVELNSDGTADVTETWNIYIEDTNTLFKTFEIDKSKYKEITDVSVTEVSNGSQILFTRIDQEMYHVDKGKFYALVNKDRKFEIAWGVHVENRTKTYKISYKIIDAVKNYNDCSEFYWQFISNESEIPAKHVSGIITLPEQVTDMEQFRVWAHGPLNGNIEKISNDKVKFDVSNFFERTMLEVRVTTPNSVFWENLNTQNTNKINEILKEEQKWADEANARRESIKRQQEIVDNIFTIGCILFQGLGVIIAIVVIVKITKYIKVLKESPKIVPEQKFKWYRDIPDETATPAEAGVLYYFKGGTGASYNATKYVSATMLDLCLKKYIEFEVLANAKEEIKVIIKPGKVAEELPEDEKIVYELLLDVAKDKNSFTMKDFKKYCNNNYSVLSKFLNI